jgi:6-phosphofructokinase 1
VARKLGLGELLLLGRGEELTGGRDKPSVLADALEAVIGAIFRDGGFGQAYEVVERIEKRHGMNKHFSIIVVSEGAKPAGMEEQFVQDQKKDPFGHVRLGGVGEWLAAEIEARTGYETRVTHLGHLQRGGAPTVFDRVLATRLGVHAVEMVNRGLFDHMACRCGGEICSVPYSEALAGTKRVGMDLYELAKLFY